MDASSFAITSDGSNLRSSGSDLSGKGILGTTLGAASEAAALLAAPFFVLDLVEAFFYLDLAFAFALTLVGA